MLFLEVQVSWLLGGPLLACGRLLPGSSWAFSWFLCREAERRIEVSSGISSYEDTTNPMGPGPHP